MFFQNLSNRLSIKQDQSISHYFFPARPLSELPAFYWDNKREIESVFDAVNATKLNEDNLKGAKIFHEVQKLLIINDIPNVLNVVDEWSKSATTYVLAHHMFSRILNFLFVNVFREKIVSTIKITVLLPFYNLVSFLNENP